MDARNNIATDLFYKIRSRFSGLKLGAETGEITINPEESRFFDFDYMEGEQPIGHVSISLAEPNSMKVYFSSGITESMDSEQKDNWYGFLKELRKFAKRRLLSFDTRDIAKDNLDKRDYAFLSQNAQPKQTQPNTVQQPVGESIMSESQLYGTKNVSYQKLENTRLIIKHSQQLSDDMAPGARSRNIAGLFVENADGERFKYPFIHLSGARAMQRHVANGGKPYDEIGESIIRMSEEIAQLKSFGNYVVRNDLMNSATNNVVERSTAQLNHLRETIARLAKQSHYEAYRESFQAQSPIEIPQDVVEQFKDQFTVRNFKEDIASVFPVLYRLMQEESTIGYDDIVAMTTEEQDEIANEDVELDTYVDPFAKFEEWAMGLGESSAIQSEDPEEQQAAIKQLQELVGQHFPAGVDGTNAIESLKGIIEDPELAQAIKSQSKTDPDGCVRPLVKAWLEQNAPEAIESLDFGDMTDIEDPAAYADQAADDDAVAYGQDTPKEAVNKSDVPAYLRKQQGDDPLTMKDIEKEKSAGKLSHKDTLAKNRGETDEAKDEVEKDPETGKVKSWKHTGDWEKSDDKDPRGKVTHMSDVARRKSEKMNVQELAEFIHSFYDKESGTFPKGPEGVATMVGKKFGEQAEMVARKMVERMAPQQQDPQIAELARIRELAGM
jgi:hypothetical protein